MNRITIIFISILLILASLIIHFFIDTANTSMDEEWIGFFTGLCFGTGIMLPFTLLNKRKKS